MCNSPQYWFWGHTFSGFFWAAGWATGWLQGSARNASMLSQLPTPKMRTPVLRLHVETSRLNPHARLNERNATPFLQRVV